MTTAPPPLLLAALRVESRDPQSLLAWEAPAGPGDRWVAFRDAGAARAALAASPTSPPSGGLYLVLEQTASDRELAALRNQLWPRYHVTAHYRSAGTQVLRRGLSGESPTDEDLVEPCQHALVLSAHPVQEVMSPATTQVKFDQNAKSWDGQPGSATYAHFRWMRRFVALYQAPAQANRILDFGCGAGWVGIEAALRQPQAQLAFFDPSPEMVRIAEENAQREGVRDFEGRVGFGEDPPFPRVGEAPFDWVISSGVISFSPDPEAWVQGLLSTLAPNARLIVGDIHGGSWGFRRRRQQRPLLPVREMNAKDPAQVRRDLEAAGLKFLGGSGYQCTFPIPELTHVGGKALGRVATLPLLGVNRAAAWMARVSGGAGSWAFDSWVMAFDRRA